MVLLSRTIPDLSSMTSLSAGKKRDGDLPPRPKPKAKDVKERLGTAVKRESIVRRRRTLCLEKKEKINDTEMAKNRVSFFSEDEKFLVETVKKRITACHGVHREDRGKLHSPDYHK